MTDLNNRICKFIFWTMLFPFIAFGFIVETVIMGFNIGKNTQKNIVNAYEATNMGRE